MRETLQRLTHVKERQLLGMDKFSRRPPIKLEKWPNLRERKKTKGVAAID